MISQDHINSSTLFVMNDSNILKIRNFIISNSLIYLGLPSSDIYYIYARHPCMNSGISSKLLYKGREATRSTRLLMHIREYTQFQSCLSCCILDNLPWLACGNRQLIWGNLRHWVVRHRWRPLRWVRVLWMRSDCSFCRWYHFWWEWEGWYIFKVVRCLTLFYSLFFTNNYYRWKSNK